MDALLPILLVRAASEGSALVMFVEYLPMRVWLVRRDEQNELQLQQASGGSFWRFAIIYQHSVGEVPSETSGRSASSHWMWGMESRSNS